MVILLIVLAFMAICIYLYHENTSLKLDKYLIKNKKIPENFNGYKIAHISDFHNTKSERLIKSIINKLVMESPDIIVITGDYIDSRRTRIDIAFDFAKQLTKITDVYYVPGNHESRIKEYGLFKEAILSTGVKVLENDIVVINKNGEKINLLGIKDPAFFYDASLEEKNIVREEIKSLSYNKELYTMLLSHRPELLKVYADEKINLVFTGHAHGGQIRLPFIGGVIAPMQGWFPKFTEGIHKLNDTTMIISRGIGNSLFPFRVNNRPELIIVELKNE